MKIAVIGASGKAGQLITKEAVDRGHEVTAIVRSAAKFQGEAAHVVEKEIFDLKAADLSAYDVVVNAFGAPLGQEQLHLEAGRALIAALKEAPNTRLIVVGGAGSLFVDDSHTTRVFETPEFPEFVLATAKNQGQNLQELQQSEGIQWTFLSPSAFFDPEGKRTGAYTSGLDQLLVNSQGNSYISYADYAIAVIDEIEKPQHVNRRFTVVGEAE
ncbi:dihydrodipicolinate reductase [Paenibacillus curdlanolyticus YK9]|uniref:Dihydrodipicolinate reductase n=1 Tax=Paenibacillus curdlanolyticus YK9 TaxID=717606 RepID=E0ICR4_9BACL|nr:NAD(P)-dependent oxidoreductase [Paenibacillus curdlanolyticus]EFM09950.1 dihydrodipicolinate reductase [Paenibacillus curdlanolyticus YK9]